MNKNSNNDDANVTVSKIKVTTKCNHNYSLHKLCYLKKSITNFPYLMTFSEFNVCSHSPPNGLKRNFP